MNLRHWQHFLEIAMLGSLSAAAAKTGVAQPVLSREMNELEQAVGATLLVRHSRGVRLTEAGERFRRRADAILQQVAAVPREVQAIEGEPSGDLAVGFPPSFSGMVTATAVALFHRRYPAVRLEVREAMASQIRDALLSREIEVGIVTLPLIESELALSPLMSEPMVLIARADRALAEHAVIDIRHIADLPLILAKRPNSVRLVVENALQEIGVTPKVVLETDVAPITEFVRRGIGYAVLPRSYVIGRDMRELLFRPVESARIAWAIALLKGREPSIAAQRMCEIVRAQVAVGLGEETMEAILREGKRTHAQRP